MAITYKLDPEAGLIETKCEGAVTLEEVFGHFKELEKDPRLPSGLDVLLDLSEMETTPWTGEIQLAAGEIERTASLVTWGACAIIVDRDALFGMIRMYEVYTEGVFSATNALRTEDEARSWLASVRASRP